MHRDERKFLFTFPGQGSQYPGMGSDIYAEFRAARDVFDRAGDVLGYDLAEICFTRSGTRLDATIYTQPAVLTHSIACLQVFKDLTDGRVAAAATAGHSLGEYSALVAAGAITFDDALRLVARRAEAMAAHGRGRMVAVRLGAKAVRPMAERFYCAVGGCNLPNQTVVGGADADLQRFCENAARGHRASATMLSAEGAFHTYLMVAAAEAFRPALERARLSTPNCPVVSSYSGGFHEPEPAAITSHLFFQMFNPVRWISGMETALATGIDAVVEFGGGAGTSPEPAGRRPNLESVTRALLRREGGHALYLPAINSRTLKRSAGLVRLLDRVHDAGEGDDRSQPTPTAASQRYRLYVITRGGRPTGATVELLHRIDDLALDAAVEFIAESAAQNLESLGYLAPALSESPQPYLEMVIESESAAVLHFFGEEIEHELRSLSARQQHAPRGPALARAQ